MEKTEWLEHALDLGKRGQLFHQSSSELEKIDEEFKKLIVKYDTPFVLLFYYNEFRITHIAKLPKTRPHVLLGGPIRISYPNVHSYPLFEFADVMCLTAVEKPFPYRSAIHCSSDTLFANVLKNLPPGFTPDFFWDNQVEHKHFIPYGINIAPFPTVASICHIFLHKTIEHICELFDLIIPISASYTNVLKQIHPEKILDLPFGFNWASLDKFIKPNWSKSIDVCLTFDETDSHVYKDKRNKVIELTKKFQEKYNNRFSILIKSKMTKTEYIDILQKSRITINVTSINGPHNYRTVEAMSASSMIFQYDWEEGVLKNYFSENFIDGMHGASFNEENFERKLLYFLENPLETEKIARQGREFLIENFSYKKLFQDLIEKINKAKIKRPLVIPIKESYYHTDMAYYYQNNELVDLMSYGVLNAFDMSSWIQFNNLMVLAGTLDEKGLGQNLFMTLIPSFFLQSGKLTNLALMSKLYEQALIEVPEEHAWIIRWNFLLLSIEQKQCKSEDLKNMLMILDTVEGKPFNEKEVIFKYYLKSDQYPNYMLGSSTTDFISFNLDLMKVVNNKEARALLYRDYALKAVKYFIHN